MNLRKLFKIAISLVFLLFIYLGYSYYKSSEPSEIPMIEPESRETKIKPTDAGGIILPHTDSIIYENMSKGGTVKKITILPEPEQALSLSGQKNGDVELENSIDTMLASIISPSENDSKISDESHIVESIFEDIPGDTEQKELQEQEESPSNFANANSLNVVKVTAGSNNKIGEVKNYTGRQKGNYKIQLASMKSESLAIAEGERIKRKHSKILGNSTITHKKVQQEKDGFFYIILAGDYLTLSKAKSACKKLSARQQSCMIYQP